MPVPTKVLKRARAVFTGEKETKKRKRRRARLTIGERHELTWIKDTLGKTAAARALPFYMGRGA